jgi:hypothetical protein
MMNGWQVGGTVAGMTGGAQVFPFAGHASLDGLSPADPASKAWTPSTGFT